MADRLAIKVYGPNKVLQPREILMSFGLLNTLVRIVGDMNRVGILDIDPDIAAEVLSEVLAARTPSGQRVDPQPETPDLPTDQAEAIFDWVKQAILDFFVRRLSRTAELMETNKEALAPIVSFLSGLPASPSNAASSGLSASDPAP